MQSPLNINTDITEVIKVHQFKYQGSIFVNKGRIDREVKTNKVLKGEHSDLSAIPLLLHPMIKIKIK